MNESLSTAGEDLKAEVLESVAAEQRYSIHSQDSTARVWINIDPDTIPFASADIEFLTERLRDEFRTSYDPPPNVPSQILSQTPLAELMRGSLQNNDLVTFKGGR